MANHVAKLSRLHGCSGVTMVGSRIDLRYTSIEVSFGTPMGKLVRILSQLGKKESRSK